MTLQFRKGVDSDRLTITPAVGEPIYTTDTKQLYIGDGSTAGGVVVSGGGGGGIDSAATIALIDSAYVQARQITYDFLDSSEAINLIDSAYVQARQTAQDFAYSSLTGAPNVLDSADVALIAQANDTTRDSAFVTGIIDSAYINARVSATDSATVSSIITQDVDAAFINALTIDADTLGGQNSAYHLDYNNFTNTPTLYDSGNFTGQLTAASTSDLSEGTNLYYTTARHDSDFDARLSGGTGVTVSSGEVSIGQAVGTGDSVTFSGLTVSGDLNVTGTTTTVNSITYTVVDPLLHLADSNETSDAVDIGFIGHYSPDGGATKEHTGFFRDASNSQYYIFNGLVDAAFDSSLPTNIVDRNGTGFELATLNVGSLVGQYAGFDSDLTANVTNTFLRGIIDDSSLTIDGDGSTGGVKIEDGGITIRTNTGSVAFADFYCEVSNAHRTRVKSADHASYSGNVDVTLPTSTGTLALTSDIPTAVSSLTNDANYLDSTTVTGVIDSAYVQARQSSVGSGGLDSAATISLIDSSYVQTRQSTVSSGATTISTFNFEADSGQTTFSGADIDANSLTYTTGKLNVYLNGILLVDSNDYTATNGTSVVLGTAADSADIVTVISYITQPVGTLDSAGVTNLIDSAYITARASAYDSGNFTGQLTAATGTSVLAHDANLQSFVDTFTLPTSDGSVEQALVTNGSGTLSFATLGSVADSASTIALIDSAYVQARVTLRDSAFVTSIIDSSYVAARDNIIGTDVLAYDANLQSFVTTFTLPTSDGTINQVLVTNGSGTISFADQSGGLDSALITQLIDSAYVQAREGAGGGTTQQAFKTISVSGQSDVVADDSADTLTLVAGTGISLTTDAGTDTITITASGGAGGGLDSAATNTLIDAKLQVLDVSDVVGADGNYGEYLKSLGNGEAEWTDLATQAKQKAFAMNIIFG